MRAQNSRFSVQRILLSHPILSRYVEKETILGDRPLPQNTSSLEKKKILLIFKEFESGYLFAHFREFDFAHVFVYFDYPSSSRKILDY